MANAREQYDRIGEAFEGFKALPIIQYGEVPGVLAEVGDVTGKSVIDFGGGTGFYAREFKRRGAADVFCIDISGEMIAVGEKIEQAQPLGVRYAVGDVAELAEPGEPFDIAVAVQLFNYADDMTAVEKMCRTIHASVKPGAPFVLFAQNPDYRFDGPPLDKYGFRCEAREGDSEHGIPTRITALLPGQEVSFDATPPKRETYERCLTEAGFTDVTWISLPISPAGIEKFGSDFWQDFYANPPLTLLRCRA